MFDWTLGIIESFGYAGIFFLMVLENIFPPIPSELIIPLAGFASAAGQLNIFWVIIAATLGAVVGSIPWYYLGLFFSSERLKKLSLKYGRLLTLSPSNIDTAESWFNAHGKAAVLFGRLIPTIRTLISVPAGLAKMPLSTFLLYTAIGSTLWTTALSLLGFVLQSQYDKIGVYLNPVSDFIVFLIIAIYLYRVITFKKVD